MNDFIPENTGHPSFDKNMFFKIIDQDDHFELETKETYWKYFNEECRQDLVKLYNDGDRLFPENPDIHHHLRESFNHYYDVDEKNKRPETGEIKQKETEESSTSPIVGKMKKKTAITWGYNDDVKNK